MKRLVKLPLIRAALAYVIAVLLAVTVLPAQDDLDKIRQEAEQGDAAAQFILGLMCHEGEGVLKDDAEAVRWYPLQPERRLPTRSWCWRSFGDGAKGSCAGIRSK